MPATSATVIGRGGLRGRVETPGWTGLREGALDVRLDDGRLLSVPAALLEPIGDATTYFLPLAPSDLPKAEAEGEAAADCVREVVIPVVHEEIAVGRRRVETGRVRVTKTVRAVEELVEAPTVREEVEVVRVPVDRIVESAEPVRTEGETTVVPVHEEVLVVEKRLRVREELRLTTRRVEVSHSERVTLRREEVAVERIPTSRPASANGT